MVDLVALLLLVVALLQAPKDLKHFALDSVDASRAHVESVDVTRTDDGFTIKEASGQGSTVTVKRHAEKEGVYVVSLGEKDKPVEVDVGDVLKQLAEGTGDQRTAKKGDHEIKVTTHGDVQYVMVHGQSSMFVRRPAKAPEKTLTGTLKHRKDTGRMSADNYRYGEFILTLDDMRVITLVPSAQVTKDDLTKLDGKKVDVTGVDLPAVKVDPREAHPTDGAGKALPRAPRFEVRSAKARE